jgi:Mg-chelatase subunit ChlI
VGLFNILQEGDVQIKGYPVRLPLDVLMAFTANPRTTPRAARSSRRSRTASARRSARTIR